MFGIITGDIVASGEINAEEREQLLVQLNLFLESLKGGYIDSFEMFRGDSFQCKSIEAATSLRIALMIRSFFRSYTGQEAEKSSKGYFSTDLDVRLAIGIGGIDFLNKSISTSDGEAFRLSGEALDELKDKQQRLVVRTAKEDFNEQVESAILLTDNLIQKWTQHQAELVLYKLQDMKENEIAAKLNISQPAVTQRKQTSQWFAVEKLVAYFEKTVKAWSK